MGTRGYSDWSGEHRSSTPLRHQIRTQRSHSLPLASNHVLWQAFVLTRSKTHYRTSDRGKSWQSFDMPASPAYVGKPLSFHSDPKKYGYILYQGTSCQAHGWGEQCHDEVRPTLLRTTRDIYYDDTDILH